MTSEILSGEPLKYIEPKEDTEYEVLSLPSKITLDYVEGTKWEKGYGDIIETVVHVKISELNEIRLPIDANPRKPEKLPVVIEIQKSAADPSPNYFVFKNNGIDIFCSNLEDNESCDNNLIVTFGNPETKDGICNGGLTYYSLQKIKELNNEAQVKVRFYKFKGAPLELKSAIAKAKNRNRSVATSDDANFMGYYDRIKEQLGEFKHIVKWETGDIELLTDNPISIQTLIRYLYTLKIGEAYHWEKNPDAHQITSHKGNTKLLTSSQSHLNQFIRNMSGGD